MDNNNSSSNKKPQSSYHGKSSSGDSQRKSSDVHANSNKQRHSRRREQLPTPRNDQQQQQRNARQQQQQQAQQPAKLRPNVDKRPRARGGGGSYDLSAFRGEDGTPGGSGLAYAGAGYSRGGDFDHELNSVYAQGSKKQNLNHLLNFHCVPRELERGHHHQHQQHHHGLGIRKQRYNKEQFLQANFQFVIRTGAKAQVNGSPDTLIDWSYIEQINIQTTEELQCPICLYPPVAAKLTRCGHAYCWPCLLHYLSLSDKTWRKCPICYDAIHAGDLKSCTIEQQRDFQVGDKITFELMRRRKGSMFIEKYAAGLGETFERFPFVFAGEEAKRYSKFLIARRSDVGAIIERERAELLAESDDSCPEDIFIQQALVMLQERGEKLGLEKPDPRDEEEMPPLVCAESETKIDIEKSDDASISSGEASSSLSSSSNNHNKYYYFYQSNDGQNIYLHPLNVKMLQACYGTLDLGPLLIEAQIVQMEQHSMDEEHRRKFTCLGHLPLTCQFSVVEVELQQPIVSGGILKLFKEDILHRKKERQRRDREERKREQHINEINDRQMGKLIASAANLNLSSSHEFPTCGFEEALPTPSGSLPMTISHEDSGLRHSSVNLANVSPKQELWPTIGSGSPGSSAASLEFQVGAWGRSAPPPPRAVLAPRTSDEDFEQRSVGHWGLGELLVGALDQKKQKAGAGKANPSAPGESKKQKKAKGKKMVPLFAVGMNRAP
ncbi:LOW QUALITY PROTEIN: RING finger protein 10 [Drosophila ficusphila]|uniref:LOW QUALITY PROTEIN: RING finger protein 10 n=1 Tax=Drosophila ficusphila TaxID=30025 RepID=UPI0007E5D522|nr:LOW QUALITY PROTEIN: RING finger protein 10 [Drosophila ficusphila]